MCVCVRVCVCAIKANFKSHLLGKTMTLCSVTYGDKVI